MKVETTQKHWFHTQRTSVLYQPRYKIDQTVKDTNKANVNYINIIPI